MNNVVLDEDEIETSTEKIVLHQRILVIEHEEYIPNTLKVA